MQSATCGKVLLGNLSPGSTIRESWMLEHCNPFFLEILRKSRYNDMQRPTRRSRKFSGVLGISCGDFLFRTTCRVRMSLSLRGITSSVTLEWGQKPPSSADPIVLIANCLTARLVLVIPTCDGSITASLVSIQDGSSPSYSGPLSLEIVTRAVAALLLCQKTTQPPVQSAPNPR